MNILGTVRDKKSLHRKYKVCNSILGTDKRVERDHKIEREIQLLHKG